MNEHAILTLLGIASVATAISGFSGVVAVFGSRAEGRWLPEERFRTTNMLILSLGVCLLSFVPLTEELFQIPDRPLWMIAGSLLDTFCATYLVYTVIRIRKLNLFRPGILIKWVAAVYFFCLTLAIFLQSLSMVGMWADHAAGSFIAGLLLMLIPAGLQFAFLVLAPLSSYDSQPLK